MHSSC